MAETGHDEGHVPSVVLREEGEEARLHAGALGERGSCSSPSTPCSIAEAARKGLVPSPTEGSWRSGGGGDDRRREGASHGRCRRGPRGRGEEAQCSLNRRQVRERDRRGVLRCVLRERELQMLGATLERTGPRRGGRDAGWASAALEGGDVALGRALFAVDRARRGRGAPRPRRRIRWRRAVAHAGGGERERGDCASAIRSAEGDAIRAGEDWLARRRGRGRSCLGHGAAPLPSAARPRDPARLDGRSGSRRPRSGGGGGACAGPGPMRARGEGPRRGRRARRRSARWRGRAPRSERVRRDFRRPGALLGARGRSTGLGRRVSSLPGQSARCSGSGVRHADGGGSRASPDARSHGRVRGRDAGRRSDARRSRRPRSPRPRARRAGAYCTRCRVAEPRRGARRRAGEPRRRRYSVCAVERGGRVACSPRATLASSARASDVGVLAVPHRGVRAA